MKEIKEIQRQIEIAAMVYEMRSFFSEFDLAEIFKTSLQKSYVILKHYAL